MAEPPGAQPALGIDAVEWLATGESTVTVVVTGRWRRRPSWRGRPVLVIDAHGRRHRFPAIPEPPSVAGATPGTWRMSFSIPAWLAPHLGGHAWLQLGVVVVPLPGVVEPAGSHGSTPAVSTPDASTLAGSTTEAQTQVEPEGQTGSASEDKPSPPAEGEGAPAPGPAARGGEERARHRAQDVLAAAADLSERIRQLESERRAAEQRAHAEHARRIELEEQQAELQSQAARWRESLVELASAEARIRELEQEMVSVRRRADEAQQLAGRAEAERDQILRELERARQTPWRTRLPAEIAVARRVPSALQVVAGRATAVNGPAAEQAREQLRREQSTLETADMARWRDRNTQLEEQLRDHALRAARLYDVIEELRAVLDAIRGVPATTVTNRETASPPNNPTASPGGVVEPVRLDAALSRLRGAIPLASEAEDETIAASEGPSEGVSESEPAAEAEEEPSPDSIPEAEPTPEDATESESEAEPAAESVAEPSPEALIEPSPEPEPEPPPPPGPTRKSWLLRVLRAMAKDDAATAGRLVLGLLPAQRTAYAEPVAYDLLLQDTGCVRLTARGDEPNVSYAPEPRELNDVDFRVTGELETLARLLAAGRVRRRVGRRMARVDGNRRAFSALTSLVRTPLGLKELHAAGMRLDSSLTFSVVAHMVDPKWTAGHHFTIAHRARLKDVYLHVLDGARPSVTGEPPRGPVATTIVCDPEILVPLLAGESDSGAMIRGEQHPLELLREWVRRAQSA